MSQRSAVTIAAATIAAAAVVTAGLLGMRYVNASNVAATPPPSPTFSSVPTTPAPSPTATEPPGPPVREATIDDATVKARIVAPRTGETWTTPTLAPDMASLLTKGQDGWTSYLVGHRGSARIYVVTDNFRGTEMIAEVDASGARQISCPSARSTDACSPSAGVPGVTLDTSTFYDSLTLPASIDIGSGWSLDTSLARTITPHGSAIALASRVDPSSGFDGFDYLPVASVGGLRVVEETAPMGLFGVDLDLDIRSYVLVAPTGLTYEVDPQTIPGADYESIRWDDGVTRNEDAAFAANSSVFGADSYGAGSVGCMVGQFSVQPGLDRSQWSLAGQTREGAPVYVPTKSNPLVHTIRAVQVDAADMARSDGGGYPGPGENRAYPFASDAAFREAHALYAIAGPDGVWQIRLRGDAVVGPVNCGD